jgi:hypothetical protein
VAAVVVSSTSVSVAKVEVSLVALVSSDVSVFSTEGKTEGEVEAYRES